MLRSLSILLFITAAVVACGAGTITGGEHSPKLAAASRPIATVPATAGALLGNGVSTVTAVPPGPAGNVLQSNGSTWISGAVPATDNGWVTSLDCDLAAEPTTNLNTFGTFSMCGLPAWRNEPANNTAVFGGSSPYLVNPSGTLDLTNGAGLAFTQAATAETRWGSITGVTVEGREGSAVWISLANLGVPSSYTYTSELRIWVNVSSQSIAECAFTFAPAGLAIGIDNDQYHGRGVGTGKWVGFVGARSCTSTTNPTYNADVIMTPFPATAPTGPSGQTAWTSANATTVVYTGPIARFGGNLSMPATMWQSAYSGGWAAEQTLIPWATSLRTISSGQTIQAGVGFLQDPAAPMDILDRFGLMLASFKVFSLTPGNVTVSRLRVDYKL